MTRCPRCGAATVGEVCPNPRCGVSVADSRCRCGRLVYASRWPGGVACSGCGLTPSRCPCSPLGRRARATTATPRQRGTNPRARGTNPRARLANPRAVAEMLRATADAIPPGVIAGRQEAARVLSWRRSCEPECWDCQGRGWVWAEGPPWARRVPCACVEAA